MVTLGEDPPEFPPKYVEEPCECGYTYENQPYQFEVYNLNIGKIMLGDESFDMGSKRVPRCYTCKKVSLLIRQN